MKKYLSLIFTYLKVTLSVSILYLLIYGVVYLVFDEKLLDLLYSVLFILLFSLLSTLRYPTVTIEMKSQNGYAYKEDLIDALNKHTLMKFEHNDHIITVFPSIVDRFFVRNTIIEVKKNTVTFIGPKVYVHRIINNLELVDRSYK